MARRRHFLIGVTTASTIAIAGCSGTDLEDLQGESNNKESEEDEDADEQTGPEAAFEQYRTALKNGDADTANEIIYTDGDFNELDDSFETPDIETIEYEISEVSPTEYESQTGNDFAEERIELTETGGDDFAIIRWDEELIGESGEERSFEQYFLLHQIDQEWLIVDFIGSARAESEDEGTEEGPQEPVVDDITVETSPRVRVSPQIRNPTDETVERQVWVRVASKDGGTLATRSKIVTLPPTGDGAPAATPFFFTDVAWSGTEVDTENTEAVLTATDAGSPFNETESTNQTNDVNINQVVGVAADDGERIQTIRAALNLASGSGPINLSRASYVIDTPDSETLVNGNPDEVDGLTFDRAQGLEDNATILSDQEDIMIVEFDLSKIDGVQTIGSGSEATIIVTTPSGTQTYRELGTPRQIREGESYLL